MENIYTNTDATFTAANGQTFPLKKVFDAVRKSIEVYGKKGGQILSSEDLEDLFQDTILKVLKYSGSFDPERASLSTWVGQIVASCKTDAYKRAMKQAVTYRRYESLQECPDEDGGEAEWLVDPKVSSVRSMELAPNRAIETKEAEEEIWAALGSLKENYQHILDLSSRGLKPQGMAEVLGCTPDAAATLLHRARKALAKKLDTSLLSDYGIAA